MLCFAPWQFSHWNVNMYLIAFNNYFRFVIIKNMSRFISNNLCWKKATLSLAKNPHFLACPLMVLCTMSEWFVNWSWHPFCGLYLIVSFISISWPSNLTSLLVWKSVMFVSTSLKQCHFDRSVFFCLHFLTHYWSVSSSKQNSWFFWHCGFQYIRCHVRFFCCDHMKLLRIWIHPMNDNGFIFLHKFFHLDASFLVTHLFSSNNLSLTTHTVWKL